jgi:hypothetical protein
MAKKKATKKVKAVPKKKAATKSKKKVTKKVTKKKAVKKPSSTEYADNEVIDSGIAAGSASDDEGPLETHNFDSEDEVEADIAPADIDDEEY